MWSTRSELFTDSRRGYQQWPVFPTSGSPPSRGRIRICLSVATALVCVLLASRLAAGAEPDAGAAAAPAAPLDGIVLRKGDRVPIPGVTVVAGGAARAVTGDDGRFAFAALPAGELTLQFRGPTTSPADTTVTITPGKRLSLTIHVDSR